MKYLIIELLNPTIDACAHHESRIATCSDGGGQCVPWVSVRSKLLDDYEAAKEMAKMFCKKQYEELAKDVFEAGGWYIASSCPDIKAKMWIGSDSPYTLYLCKDVTEDLRFEKWLYSYKILEIDDPNFGMEDFEPSEGGGCSRPWLYDVDGKNCDVCDMLEYCGEGKCMLADMNEC